MHLRICSCGHPRVAPLRLRPLLGSIDSESSSAGGRSDRHGYRPSSETSGVSSKNGHSTSRRDSTTGTSEKDSDEQVSSILLNPTPDIAIEGPSDDGGEQEE